MRLAVTERDSSAELTWDIAHLFPVQGNWSEEEYLALETNHLIELSHGNLEVLAMPGQRHQRIVAFLFQLLAAFVAAGSRGEVLTSPFPVRLWPGKYREPDIVFMRAENKHRQQEQYWDGADLVVEVVSPDDPNRDWVTKRQEYAQAGIPEYWIVDRRSRTITVLRWESGAYALHGEFAVGAQATSVLLSGFAVAVEEVFAAAG